MKKKNLAGSIRCVWEGPSSTPGAEFLDFFLKHPSFKKMGDGWNLAFGPAPIEECIEYMKTHETSFSEIDFIDLFYEERREAEDYILGILERKCQ